MISNRILSLFFLVFFFILSPVLAEDELPVSVEVVQGECINVDLNQDQIPDVIICYNEDDTITIDDLISIGEDIPPVSEDNVTIIIPSSVTTIKRYELPFDEEVLRDQIIGEYSNYIYALGGVSLISLFLIVILFNKLEKRKKKN